MSAASLVLTVCLVVLTAEPARADCDVLDPTCVVETVEDTVDSATETVEDATGEAEETVDETTETAEETVEDATETVEETVESVTGEAEETVDETVGGGGPLDDVGGPLQPNLPGEDPTTPGSVEPAPPGSDVSGGASDADRTRPGAGGSASDNAGVRGAFNLDPPSLGTALVIENAGPPAPRGFLDGFVGPAAEVAKQIAFPLALVVLLLMFVAFQNRLDRKDPKLALATTAPDVLRFA